MLLRRKIDPKAGRREVRERVTKLLMAVTTTSSTKTLLAPIIEGQKNGWAGGDDSRTKCSTMLE